MGHRSISLRIAVLEAIPTRKETVTEERLLEGFEIEFENKRRAIRLLHELSGQLEDEYKLLDLDESDDDGDQDEEDDEEDDDLTDRVVDAVARVVKKIR